ncbi:MAG: hypothetical protein ACXAB2_05670 [Candidatus Hodarchaeales archaeon]|jgi:hypothetical protein
MTMKLAIWAREKGIIYKTAPQLISVAESSAETLNACGEVVRPMYKRAHLNEAGRLALSETGHTKP